MGGRYATVSPLSIIITIVVVIVATVATTAASTTLTAHLETGASRQQIP